MTQTNTVLRRAVGYLFDMDSYLMNVYDNMSWLSYGVPDGEFEEESKQEALENYKEHTWLITDFNGEFKMEKFRELYETFKSCANRKCYDKSEVLHMCMEIGKFIIEVEAA